MEDSEYVDKIHALIRTALKERVFMSVDVGHRTLRSVPAVTLDAMLSGDNLEVFYSAFTHPSYDYAKSYEKLEILGDTNVNMLAANFIDELFPHLTPGQMTNMLSHYKSNKEFAKIISSAIPEINSLILITVPIDTKILADVFEALIRAVYITANAAGPEGIGYACTQNVYRILARDFKPDERYAAGNPKSLVTEMFGSANVREMPDKNAEFKSGDTVEVTITRDGIQEANRVVNSAAGDTITKSVLRTSATGVDRSSARRAAYDALLSLLQKDYSLNPTIFQQKKQDKIIESSAIALLVRQEQDTRKEDLSFEKKTTTAGFEWRLIAQSRGPSKKRRLIAAISTSKDTRTFDQAKMTLLEYYIAKTN
ncbi:Ribonuclease III [uncultured virus]|nr:Ribonuclease III [uncultured virus]